MWTDIFRMRQWYKNLVIFLPLFFVGLATDSKSFLLVTLGFVALCLMSSANYIMNDIADKEKDKVHPEKKFRPLVSGEISVGAAGVLAAFCATLSLSLAFFLSEYFFYILLVFFSLTQLYSFAFKNELFVDVILISVNFVLRAVSGAYILGVRVSPWLIVCTFFLALFLAVGKRRAESILLKGKAAMHRTVLDQYTPSLTNALILVSTALLLLSYSLYSFLSIYPALIYTLPFSFYVVFRYYFLVESGSPIAEKLELLYTDKRLVLGIVLWVAVVGSFIYSL